MLKALGPDEIADALIISRDTAEELIRKMPHFQANPGSKRPMWRVTERDFNEWINEQIIRPADPVERKTIARLDRSLFEPDGRIKRRA